MLPTRRPPRRTVLKLVALALGVGLLPGFAAARPAAKAEHELMLGKLINSVRYGQDQSALQFMDGETEAKELLGPAWDKGTPEQRAEFIRLFHHIFAGVAFPKMRGNFEHLTTITYGAPKVAGARTDIESVLHIQAGPKEQELKVTYWLSKGADAKPRVVDVTILGAGDKSMLTNIRNDQIQPILAEGGWPKLLELMRERARELPAPADKPAAAKP